MKRQKKSISHPFIIVNKTALSAEPTPRSYIYQKNKAIAAILHMGPVKKNYLRSGIISDRMLKGILKNYFFAHYFVQYQGVRKI